MFNDQFSKIQNDSAHYPMMGDHYCSNSHPSICAIQHSYLNITSFNFQLISPAEVQQVVGKVDPNKSSGHDGIPAKVLRDCSKELALPLANLFNTSIVFERFPSDWKLAEVCLVSKRMTIVTYVTIDRYLYLYFILFIIYLFIYLFSFFLFLYSILFFSRYIRICYC